MAKTLLIICGSIEAVDAIKRAKELGNYVVVSDGDHLAPGFALADSCLIADVYGASETTAAAERFSRKIRKIDGVVSVAAGAPMTVASVAKRLGLQGISLETAQLVSDRLAMKRRLAEMGVAVPWFDEVATPQALQRAAVEHGRDLVIKPVDSNGSGGSQRVAQVADLEKAFVYARSHSPSERVMVEQYLEGPKVFTESLVIGGTCVTPGFSDRTCVQVERHTPFLIENGAELPSRLPESVQAKVREVVAKAVGALGISDGTIACNIVVHAGEPFVVGLTTGLSGDFFCTREIPLNTGVDFVGAAIKIALGEQVSADELAPKHSTSVVQRYAFAAGEVVSIAGIEEARNIAGVSDIIVTAKPGDVIPATGDTRPSAAMVLTTGSSHEEALRAANDAIACLKISVR